MRVLVTGGAGFVGSTTSQRLLEAGNSVVIIDSLALGYRSAIPQGAELITGDVNDGSLLERVLREQRIDAVLHCAGKSLVGESVIKPDEYYRANVVGALTLLDAMRAMGVRRIVFSSSAAVYGAPDKMPLVEDQPLAPINPYGRTKLAVEGMLTSFANA